MATTALADRETPPPATQSLISTRLSAMMFLQYAVWGVWLPILAKYLSSPVAGGGLGFSGGQVGWILGLAGSIGAVASPFIAGQLADRVMNAERALGLLLILGGIVQSIMTWQTSYAGWLLLSVLYSVLYMPTLALTNSVAFANLPDRERQFPRIRTFGTIGWIVASVVFPLVFMVSSVGVIRQWPFLGGPSRADEVGQIKYALLVSGIISIVYGIYCIIALPATPPNRESRRPLAFAAAFRLLTRPRVIALLIAALLVSMIHQLYFIRTPGYITDAIRLNASDVGPVMAIGQLSEIAFLAILGFFLKRIGYKWIIVLGALSYGARYAIFATIPTPGELRLAMLLHGMNYGFFFAGAFLFVERIAPADIRHSAQTVFGIIILGLGPILAGFYNQWLDSFAVTAVTTIVPLAPTSDAAALIAPATTVPATVFNYATFWAIQSSIAFAAAAVLIVGFPNRWEERDSLIADDPQVQP